MQRVLLLENPETAAALLGVLNRNASLVDSAFQVCTSVCAEGLQISGEDLQVEQAEAVWRTLLSSYLRDGSLTADQVRIVCEASKDGLDELFQASSSEVICVSAKGRPVRARTRGQKEYIKAIAENELTFAIGPAGTGKTYLAVAMAVRAYRSHQISRIILTRPAVEAGENLGFLPGDLQTKVDPYMRPIYDALYELMGADQYGRCLERGAIEISPLAYMRGRTLDDAFIILDEAQNTSPEQMKMFLTRIGFHSQAVVTGDITQIDLPRERKSGLIDVSRILNGVESTAFIQLKKEDVVRNPLVQKIIAAYEKHESQLQAGNKRPFRAGDKERRGR